MSLDSDDVEISSIQEVRDFYIDDDILDAVERASKDRLWGIASVNHMWLCITRDEATPARLWFQISWIREVGQPWEFSHLAVLLEDRTPHGGFLPRKDDVQALVEDPVDVVCVLAGHQDEQLRQWLEGGAS